MANGYSVEDLLDFLSHAGNRGLLPAATAQALAVASRNVFGVLDETEKSDIKNIDIDDAIKRFTNKRARDFSPGSLKEYGGRVRRAVEHFLRWRGDPASFSAKTRATKTAVKRDRSAKGTATQAEPERAVAETRPTGYSASGAGYQTSIPVRPGIVVTIANVPEDLTKAEAERLAGFIKLLAVT